MAYFAKINNNIVETIIRVNNEDIFDLPYPDSEPVGQAFIASIGIGGQWLQTSFNNNFRKCLAEPGSTYDEDRDVFIPRQPVASGMIFIFDDTLWRWIPAGD